MRAATSPSAITWLVDLGVPPYLINATVIDVLAQRLVRMLCPACKKPDMELTPPCWRRRCGHGGW